MTHLVEGGLEVSTDQAFHEREWAVRRVAWSVFMLILLAAALGLFGGGPLAQTSARGPGLLVEYDRFARRQRAYEVTVRIGDPGESATVAISAAYLRDATIDSVSPRPREETAHAGVQRFEFAAVPGEPLEITFRITSESFGRRAGTVRAGAAELRIWTLVYP